MTISPVMKQEPVIIAGVNFTELAVEQPEVAERLLELLEEQQERKTHQKMFDFNPYDWQMDFLESGKNCAQRLLMAGNRTGKTFTGAYEMSCHLTGRYPKWWMGRRYDKPIRAWAAGVSNPKTRDIVQTELLGPADDPTALGTGAIPLEDIVDTTRFPGVPNAKQSAIIRHYDKNGKFDGHSRLGFLSYEMGFEKFMGSPLDLIWLDEQPPYDIFSQCITRTADTGGMVYMTFTPETGMTPVIHMFMNDLKKGQSLHRAGWDQCPHLCEEVKTQLLSVYLPHERKMRKNGDPVFGRGMVFPIAEEKILIDPFPIPDHWTRISGLDFGWEHPTAVIWLAWDRDSDTIYIYDCYAENKKTIPIHALAIKQRPIQIPIAWPHDGNCAEKGSGITMANQYRAEGVNMLPFHFSNAPSPGQKEGSGGNSVEAGIMEMLKFMENGNFKVFSHLSEWFTEFRSYHRGDDGKIVKLNDDIMSATRYAFMMRRFAMVISQSGNTGYTGKIKYPDLGNLC